MSSSQLSAELEHCSYDPSRVVALSAPRIDPTVLLNWKTPPLGPSGQITLRTQEVLSHKSTDTASPRFTGTFDA